MGIHDPRYALTGGLKLRLRLDGKKIADIGSFARELARAVSEATGDKADFGWDLHSLHDHLQGGYGGVPPYEIVIEDADGMVEAMGYDGLVAYCDEMLGVIASGGRGLVQPEDQQWYLELREGAKQRVGKTLLDLLLEVARHAPTELTLTSNSGRVLLTTQAEGR